MPTILKRIAWAAPLLLAAGTALAEPVNLAFEQAIYQDAKERPLLHPEGVACSDSSVVVADTGNGRLVTFEMRDGKLAQGVESKLAQLTYPERLQLDGKGQLFAIDGKTRRIVRLDAKGAFAGTVDLKGVANASAVVPLSFKLDASDLLYVLDGAGRRVLVADASGNVTRQLALPAAGEFSDIAVDAAGTIYAIDSVGAALWIADKAATAFKPLGKGMKDKMNFPVYLAVQQGRLFIVDQYGNGVVLLGIDGSYQGRQLAIGWSDGAVYYPSQLCLTPSGAVFIADRYNNRVQYFTTVR